MSPKSYITCKKISQAKMPTEKYLLEYRLMKIWNKNQQKHVVR